MNEKNRGIRTIGSSRLLAPVENNDRAVSGFVVTRGSINKVRPVD
jgi:hypothetical protein